jgi:hypothetical protein
VNLLKEEQTMERHRTTYRAILFLLLVVFTCSHAPAQYVPTPDTTIIFTPSNPDLVRAESYRPLLHAWGLDLLTSNNGFGIGMFYRYEMTDEFSLITSFIISDVKDDTEFEQYDFYTGQNYVPNKKNRLLFIPLFASVQYRLLKDDIVDNFRPFLTAGLGPTLVFVAPYTTNQLYIDSYGMIQKEKMDFFTSIKYGRLRYTVGGFIGAGVNFGMEKGSITGLSVKYFFAPFPSGIEVMEGGYIKNIGGLFLTLSFGSMF